MQGGRNDCCILTMLINATIFITLFAFSYSAKYAAIKKTKCNIQNLYDAFTTADIQNIQQKDATLRSVFVNKTKFLPELILENYLQVPKNKKISRNRRYQLVLQNCSHQMNTCVKYIIKLHADDCILDPSNYYIYYKRRKRIYRSTVQYGRQSEFLFKINTQKTHFIYLNNKLNLLFCEQIGFEMTYNVFHHRLKTQSCILRTKLSMPYARLKRSIFKSKSGGTMTIIIIALVIIIIISVIIIIVIYCYCKENGKMEDELPKSLIENCRRAEPSLAEQGKYLPEMFDASAFQFKGPLIIECPKLQILEHDLTNAKPTGSNIEDHVRFDENLNVAYNIGENVEIIVKSYGQGKISFKLILIKKEPNFNVHSNKRAKTIGTKIGSGEMIKNGEDKDEETNNEQENGSRQSVIENNKKEAAKHLKRKNAQLQEQKSGKKIGTDVLDSRRKSKLLSVRIQKTQPSRYSESSTQTLMINGEENAKSSKKFSKSNILANTKKWDFSIGSKASTRKSNLPRKRTSTILFEQANQVPVRLRKITSTKEHYDVSSTDATNIMSKVRTTKSQHWTAEETNPSVSGSTGSQC